MFAPSPLQPMISVFTSSVETPGNDQRVRGKVPEKELLFIFYISGIALLGNLGNIQKSASKFHSLVMCTSSVNFSVQIVFAA